MQLLLKSCKIKRLPPVNVQIACCCPGQPYCRLWQSSPRAFRLKQRHQPGQQQMKPECIFNVQPAVNLVHLMQNRLQCLYIDCGEFRHVQTLLPRRLLILYRTFGQQRRPGDILLPDISRLTRMDEVYPVYLCILFTGSMPEMRQPRLQCQQLTRTNLVFLILFCHIECSPLHQQQIVHWEGAGEMPVSR